MEQIVDQKPKNNNFIVTLLSVLLLISVFIAGFFAYQTQNLVKELTKLKINTTPTVTPNAPVLPPALTKIDYTNDFILKLDKKWYQAGGLQPVQFLNYKISEDDYDFDPNKDKGKLKIEIYAYENVSDIYKLYESRNGDNLTTDNLLKNIIVDNQSALLVEKVGSLGNLSYLIVKNPFIDRIYVINFYLDFNNYLPLRNEILSTLKFIEPVASNSPLPVACTMEAKICPDGSAIGRSGPKCEFSPCPTTSPLP